MHPASAPVVYGVKFGGETWSVHRRGFRRFEVVVTREHWSGPIAVFMGSYRWLWLAKRRCRKGGV